MTAIFPFLKLFLEEYDSSMKSKSEGQLKSDLWTEVNKKGKENLLQAVVIWDNNKKYLLLISSDFFWDERRTVLQKAREQMLLIEKLKKTQNELKKAQKKAEDANQAKSEFLANISHEIRSPLNAISGFIQILINKSSDFNLPVSFIKYLNLINIGGQNLSEVINDTLDVLKIEAGKSTALGEDINLIQLMKNIFHLNTDFAGKKNINFLYHFHDSVPQTIKSDKAKIKKILMNLINNAIKFTPEKGEVRFEVSLEEKKNIVFKVKDSGIGIPKNRLDSIFQPFEQADMTIDRTYGGTGLGLAITKKMVEILKGEINVESEEHKGSIFTVKIPYTPADSTVQSEKEIDFKKLNFSPDNLVLVIEDNLINQKMIQFLFQELGIKVIIAEDGKTGVSKAYELKPDMILMDIHIPLLNGYEATRLIRKNPDCAETPIVFLTADSREEQKEKALKHGVNDYLLKPIELKEMIPILRKYLKKAD
jgi:signal transduction histidine kinase/ActR/RegA family two-component response regulator